MSSGYADAGSREADRAFDDAMERMMDPDYQDPLIVGPGARHVFANVPRARRATRRATRSTTRSRSLPPPRRASTQAEENSTATDAIELTGARIAGASESLDRSKASGKRHFNIFLETLGRNNVNEACRLRATFGENGIARDVFDDAPNMSYDTLDKSKATHILLDKFAHYLAEVARPLNGNGRDEFHLSMNAASRYLSAIKCSIIEDVANSGLSNPSIENDRLTNSSRSYMIKIFERRAAENHEDTVQSHQTATRDDLMAIAAITIWSQLPHLAVFYSFFITLVQIAGRGSEAAHLKFTDLHMHTPSHFQNCARTDKVVRAKVWRQKTVGKQDLTIFNDRDNPFLDFYVAMAFSMLSSDDQSDYVFPDFEEKTRTQAQRRSSSGGASQYFRSLMRAITSTCNELNVSRDGTTITGALHDILTESHGVQGVAEDDAMQMQAVDPINLSLTPGITMHSAKRCGVNEALSVPSLKTDHIKLRAGWLHRAANTINDYICARNDNDEQVGLGLSSWTIADGRGRLDGGRPPKMESIAQANDDESDKTQHFVAALFYLYENTAGANDRAFQNIICASLLRVLPKIIDLLVSHPQSKFGISKEEVWTRHKVLNRLVIAAQAVGITDPKATLLRWSHQIHRRFVANNFAFVSAEELEGATVDGQPLMADPRAIWDLLHQSNCQLRQINYQLEMQSSEQQAKIGDMTVALNNLTLAVGQMHAELAARHGIGGQVIAAFDGMPAAPVVATGAALPLAAPQVLRDTEALGENAPTLLRKLSVGKAFSLYHLQQWYNTIHNSGGLKKQAKSTLKKALSYFALFLPEQVPAITPNGAHPSHHSAAAWRATLNGLVATAEGNIESLLKEYLPNGQKFPLTVHAFEKAIAKLPDKMLLRNRGYSGCYPNEFQPPSGRPFIVSKWEELFPALHCELAEDEDVDMPDVPADIEDNDL